MHMKRAIPNAEQLAALEKYGVPVGQIENPSLVEYAAGEYLCRDGMPVQQILFLLSGRAKVLVQADNGENLILALYDGFGVLDDMDLFLEEGIYHASCQTITAVRGVALPIIPNREILLASNAYLRKTCRSFARSMQLNRNQANNILYPLENRLCSYIALMETPEGWDENLSHVSEILGTSYRHLLRTLQSLCKRGLLERTGAGYRVGQRAAFERLVREFYSPTE